MSDTDLEINVRMDAGDVEDALRGIAEQLDNLPDNVSIALDLDAAEATSTLNDIIVDISSLTDFPSTVELLIDASNVDDVVADVSNELQNLGPYTIDLNITAEDVEGVVDAIRDAIDEISDARATAIVAVDDWATADLERVLGLLEEIDGTKVIVDLEAEGDARSTVEEIRETIDSFESGVTIPIIAENSVTEVIDAIKDDIETINNTPINLDTTEASESFSNLNVAVEGVGESLIGLSTGLGLERMVNMAGSVEDSWKRVELAFKGSGVTMDQLKESVSSLTEETGRSGASIRETFINLGVAGVDNIGILEDSVRALSVIAFITGRNMDQVASAMARAVMSPTLNMRVLQTQLRISSEDIKNAGYSVDQLKESWKNLTPEQRAAILNQIMLTKYGRGAVEEYKNSWAGAKEQISIALNSIIRTLGDLVLPFVVPALKTIAWALQGIGGVVKALPGPVKALAGGFLFLVLGGSTLIMTLTGISKVLSHLIPGWLKNTALMRGLFGEGGRLASIGPRIGQAMGSAMARISGGLSQLRGSFNLTTLRAEGLRGAMSRIRGIPGGIITGLKRLRDSLMSTTIAQRIFNTEQDRGVLASIRNAVATAAQAVKNAVLTAATYALAGAQALLNAIMSANPIVLIVLAVTALIGAILYLWRTNEGFRKALTGFFGWLQGLVGWIGSGLMGAINWILGGLRLLTGGFQGVGPRIIGALQKALSYLPYVFMGPIGLAFAAVKRLFRGFKWPKIPNPTLPNLARIFWDALVGVGRAVSKWFKNFKWPKPPSFSISSVFKAVPGELKKFFSWLFKWISNPFRSLFSIIKKLWDGFLKGLLTGFYNWGKNLILNFLRGVYNTFKSTGRKVLDWIASHFPHSPPKRGPLSEVTEDGMTQYGAGLMSALNKSLNTRLSIQGIGLPGAVAAAGAPLGLGAGAAGGEVNISVNVDVSTGPVSSNVDVEGLADKVARRVADTMASELNRKGIPAGLYATGAVRRVVL